MLEAEYRRIPEVGDVGSQITGQLVVALVCVFALLEYFALLS